MEQGYISVMSRNIPLKFADVLGGKNYLVFMEVNTAQIPFKTETTSKTEI